jgi:hypothetical protein
MTTGDGRDAEEWVRRTRRYNFWKMSFANAATLVALVCWALLLLSPAWRMALAAGVFLAAGWAILKVLDRREDAEYLAAVEHVQAPESLEFRYQAAGLVSPETAKKRVASWQDHVRTWLERAPLTEPGDETCDVIETDSVSAGLGESAANVCGRSDFAFAWTPFPGDYARSIVRTWPQRMVGSVYRTTDGRVAVRWEPTGKPREAVGS